MGKVRMFDHDDPSAEEERRASPRTTIVGGQPPKSAKELPPVPTGMEKLLRLAAVDASFRCVLLERRGDAAPAAGVELTSSERAILAAVPEAQLEAMAAQIPSPAPERRDFLRQAAASAVVALGGAALSSCECVPAGTTTLGIQPDVPPPRPDEAERTRGIAHDVPPPRPDTMPTPPGGAAPDLPPPRPDHVDTIAGEAPDPPPRPEKTHTPGRGGSAPDMP